VSPRSKTVRRAERRQNFADAVPFWGEFMWCCPITVVRQRHEPATVSRPSGCVRPGLRYDLHHAWSRAIACFPVAHTELSLMLHAAIGMVERSARLLTGCMCALRRSAGASIRRGRPDVLLVLGMRRQATPAGMLLLAAVCLMVTASGCQKALFPRSSDRTQFDQYDRLRGEYVPRTEEDLYGQTQPALRARLGRR